MFAVNWAFWLFGGSPEGTLPGVSLGLCVESAGSASLFCGVRVVCALRDVSVQWAFVRATGLTGFCSLMWEEGRFELSTCAKDGVTGCCWLVGNHWGMCGMSYHPWLIVSGAFGLGICANGDVAGGSWLVAQGNTCSLQSLIWGFRVRNSRFYTFQESNDTPVKFGYNPSAASTVCGGRAA